MQLKRIKNIVGKVGDMLNYIVIYAKEKKTMNEYIKEIKQIAIKYTENAE